MKEVEKVSLGGYAFTLDSDAVELAAGYLDELEHFYAGREGGGEILEGIEERMAELLQEKCGRDGVVSRAAIEGVISILGRPEQIESESRETEDAGTAPAKEEKGPKRKLFRNVSDKVVAGVCSGLGTYFRTDKVFFRLLFAAGTLVTFFGFGWHRGFTPTLQLIFPILYVILWICMPAARTVRQRWEQRGEDGTILGIQQRIESGANEVGEVIEQVGKSNAWSEIGRILEVVLGVVLLLVAFTGLFSGGVFLFGSGALHQGWIPGDGGVLSLGRLLNEGMTELHHTAPGLAVTLSQPWAHILLALVAFFPFLGILYGSLQLLFGFKSPKWHPGLVIFILWLMIVIATGVLFITSGVSTGWITV